MSNVKKVFLSPIMKTEVYGISLPLVPIIIIHWGTWLGASYYYSDNFTSIFNVFSKLTQFQSKKSISIMAESNTGLNLTYIQSNFRCSPVNIIKLESSGLSLFESIEVINNTSKPSEWLVKKKFMTNFRA